MKINVQITGGSPLICNRFCESAEINNGTSPAFKSGKKGLPREVAESKLYIDETGVKGVPGPNILAALISAGRFTKAGKVKLTTARSSLIPAGLSVDEVFVPLSPQSWEPDSRSVVVPATGGRIMCHRPRFDVWRLSFTLTVDESMFSPGLVRQLVDDAGKKVGLGDFRPERRGPFGRFNVTAWREAN